MNADPEFRRDLSRGTARFYDEFRVPYPAPLLDDLWRRTNTTRGGRLFNLACGTGQITFGLASRFDEIWAVDQESEAIKFAREKARELGVGNVRWIAGRAEDIDADGSFDLVAIGNAFHRLPRRAIAEAATRWLVDDGHLALLWSNSPWDGDRPWQRVLAGVMDHWSHTAGTADRVPADLDRHLADEPHATILAAAGFTIVGHFDFKTPHEWSIETLTGFMYSTSVLSPPALGRHREGFERDLRERLLAVEPDNVFREDISFAYTLARAGARATAVRPSSA